MSSFPSFSLPKIHTTTLLIGFLLGFLDLVITYSLEYAFCREEVRRLKQKKGGASLYRQSVIANLWNLGLGLPLTHYVRVVYTAQGGGPEALYNTIHANGILSVLLLSWDQVQSIVGIIVLQGWGFYMIHKAFHEYPRTLYWMHSFHHKFNDVILPSTACAVSVYEFAFGYMIPFVLACQLVRADYWSGTLAGMIIGVSNVLIHSPFMAELEAKFDNQLYPDYMTSASKHFSHHRKLTVEYGAPVIHFDHFLSGNASPIGKDNLQSKHTCFNGEEKRQ